MKKSFLVLIVLVLIISGCSALYAGETINSLEEPIDYYQLAEKYQGEENYTKAAEYYKIAYEQGNEESAAKLCTMYFNRTMHGVEVCQVAASNGDSWSQYVLATLYLGGVGIERDTQQWLKWLLISSENGFSPAQYVLGAFYVLGDPDILVQDCAKGMHWLNMAAQDYIHLASAKLGWLYFDGKVCVEQDYSVAYEYLMQAALPLPSDKERSGNMKTAYDTIGEPGAQKLLGVMYGNGYGMDINYEQSFYWFSKAAKREEAAAMEYLADFYQEGIFVDKDLKKAKKLRAEVKKIRKTQVSWEIVPLDIWY